MIFVSLIVSKDFIWMVVALLVIDKAPIDGTIEFLFYHRNALLASVKETLVEANLPHAVT